MYKPAFALLLSLPLALATACGSSSEPAQTDPTLRPDAGAPDDAEAPLKRTLVQRSLLPFAPQNLLLDVTFRDRGWGHFTSLFDGAMAQPTVGVRVLSQSPAGVSVPVATFKDSTATDEKSRGMTSIAAFLGGKGPFRARVWVSRTNAAGEAALLEDDPLVFRCALTTTGFPEGKAYDLARKDEKTFDARTWVLFEGQVDADLPGTAFFNLRFGKRGGGFLVQAPEVVPLELLPAAPTTMALRRFAKPRALAPEEHEALAFHSRLPVQLGLPKGPRFQPGMKAPRDE